MRKVLYLLAHYPQISETYIETEMRALAGRYEIEVLALQEPHVSYRAHRPYRRPSDFVAAAREARPDVIHTHYLIMADLVRRAARAAGVPFTIRAHSFDVFGPATAQLGRFRDAVNDPLCAGVLSFPPTLPMLARAGFDMTRVVAAPPVVDGARFFDRSPNRGGVMNLGAGLPKKAFTDYVRLAAGMPGEVFDLYPGGPLQPSVAAENERLGHPVRVQPPVEPEDMPREYKRHRWLVYTACPTLQSVGWPLAVAEAQAAGVGVCLRNIRPDLADYVGGAGFLFDSIEEAARIIASPPPDEIRERGFAQARRSDVRGHIHLLEDLWSAALGSADAPALCSSHGV